MFSLCDDEHWPETPRNSTVIATAAADGVHFTALHLVGRELEECPVIQVFPLSFNWECVGETLIEAIKLACQENEELLVEWQAEGREDAATTEKSLQVIEAIRTRFGLRPRPDRATRTAELTARYLPALEVPLEIVLALDESHPLRKARMLQ